MKMLQQSRLPEGLRDRCLAEFNRLARRQMQEVISHSMAAARASNSASGSNGMEDLGMSSKCLYLPLRKSDLIPIPIKSHCLAMHLVSSGLLLQNLKALLHGADCQEFLCL